MGAYLVGKQAAAHTVELPGVVSTGGATFYLERDVQCASLQLAHDVDFPTFRPEEPRYARVRPTAAHDIGKRRRSARYIETGLSVWRALLEAGF